MNPIRLGTGARPRNKKKTDYKVSSYKKVLGSSVPEPIIPIPVIYMQNQEPSCGEDAATQVRNILFGVTGSPEFGWKTLRKIDGYPVDVGSTSDGVGKQAKNIGICDLSLMPDNSTVSNATYADYSTVTQEMLTNALPRVVDSYAFEDGPFTIAYIQQAIQDHKAVILRVSCGTGFWINSAGQPSWGTDLFPLKLGIYDDDHFICITDPARSQTPIPNINPNYIYFPNSWSDKWGLNGWGWFDETYLQYVKEMLILVPPATPITPNPPKYQFTTNFGFGTTSADVHQLQIRIGMPVVYQTGYFGVVTFFAVCAFQFRNNITPTGYCGVKTCTLLNTT